MSLLPANRRIQARRIWHKTAGTMGAYLRSEVIQAFLAVIVLVIGDRVIGNDYALLTGLLAGIAWLVPLVGVIFAALLSFLIGLASSGGLSTAIAALVWTTIVLAFLEFVVEPRLFRRSQFSGVLIIVIMVMMVDAYGLTGFLIAPPLAGATQVLVSHILYAARHATTAAVELDTLGKRLQSIQADYDEAAEDDEAHGGNRIAQRREVKTRSDKSRRQRRDGQRDRQPVSYTHLRAHETVLDLVCRLLLEKKKT